MNSRIRHTLILLALTPWLAQAQIQDPQQSLERTCFQTARSYSGDIDLRSDVAIVYGIDPGLPGRIETWRDKGYRIHVMTGVSWGQYQDYLYGRFDGVNHEDEAQTDRRGNKVSHGGDVYYMSPGENYGKFLTVGVRRALDAGAKAIHLEEPEFWVRSGYSEGFKREWKAFYHEDWAPPHTSPEAQWRASQLKYYLYRRALQQIFDAVQAYNEKENRDVRCYVPTHSLLNYAHWRIVSPESSLAGLKGCDGYIAQVWTGTSRTPNVYRGQLRARTFETAFLEYGTMQNLVRSTGRRVWYLNDPVEDNPNHDWNDYRRNWESTLTASLLQPEVWRYEVMPWPNRIFHGRYPSPTQPGKRERIPAAYATEVQTVINALNDMNQPNARWECGTENIGVGVSDSLMFERGEPTPSDPHMSHIYGLALPFLKRGMPVAPVQLENVTRDGYLKDLRVLLMTYWGMQPLTPEVHAPLAQWVKDGGLLVFWDDDADPYHAVREWWNIPPLHFKTPREHLFEKLGLAPDTKPGRYPVGKGVVLFRSGNPADLAKDSHGDEILTQAVRGAMDQAHLKWKETNYLLLRRGPYVIAAGLDESTAEEPRKLEGRFINLFDPQLSLEKAISIAPGSRYFLLNVEKLTGDQPRVIASACKVGEEKISETEYRCRVEGIDRTEAVVLLRWGEKPGKISLDGKPLEPEGYDAQNGLLWLRFPNESHPRELVIERT